MQHEIDHTPQEFLQPPTLDRRGFGKLLSVTGMACTAVVLTATLDESAVAQTTPSRTSLADQMRFVRRHENDHVTFLLNALGTNARPRPTFQNLSYTSLFQFLTVGRTLENVGVGAYLGAAPAILDRGILAAAASIALVEARHAGMFNSIQSIPVTQNAFGAESSFDRAFTAAEVVNFAGGFVASLNGGPPLTYDTTPSAANDIQILNFALALEYLEAEYYNINVPRFYP